MSELEISRVDLQERFSQYRSTYSTRANDLVIIRMPYRQKSGVVGAQRRHTDFGVGIEQTLLAAR